MKHSLSIGGATYDLFVRTGRDVLHPSKDSHMLSLPLGSKIRVDDVIETCGGGASNTAVGLRRLGLASSFCGVVGSDQWGERLLKNMQHEGVDTSSATVVENETSSFSIILSVTGSDRVILYNVGTNTHLQDSTFDREAASKVDWMYLNHLHEESCMIQDDLINVLKNPHAPKLTWNPGGAQLSKGIADAENAVLLKHTALLLLNKEEALAFTHTETIEDAMTILLQAGTHTICVTDGKNGAYGANQKPKTKNQLTIVHCPTAPTTIVDTTGAGDAFGTGATWALLHGFDLPTILRAGSINAASVVAAFGAQAGLLTDTEMITRLESMMHIQFSPRNSRDSR